MAKITSCYLQRDRGDYVSPCVFSAMEGFRFQGVEIIGFEEDDLPNLPLTKQTIVCGWVRTVQNAFTLLGVEIPPPLDYPTSLDPYLGRELRKTTLADVHSQWSNSDNPNPVFIKPVRHKQFTGHTIERFSHLAETTDFPKETEIWESTTVDFRSEWRCFVHHGSLVGIKHYVGDPWLLPDKKVVIEMIKAYEDAPVAYALDVGVTPSSTLLVEVNDFFSTGNYGLSNITYCEMVEDRWKEIVGI